MATSIWNLFASEREVRYIGEMFADEMVKAGLAPDVAQVASQKKAIDQETKARKEGIRSTMDEAKQRAESVRAIKEESGVTKRFSQLMLKSNKNLDDLGSQLDASSQLLAEATKSQSLTKEKEERLIQSVNSRLRHLGIEAKSLEDVFQFEAGTKALHEHAKAIEIGGEALKQSTESIKKSDLPKHFKDLALSTKITKDQLETKLNEFGTALGIASVAVTATFKDSIIEGVRPMKERMKTLRDTFFNTEVAALNLGRSFVQATNDLRSSMRLGTLTDAGRGLFSNMWDAIQMGIDPGLLSEINAANRQALLAAGGSAKWNDMIAERQKENWKILGNLGDAAKFAADASLALGKMGIRPAIENLDTFVGRLDKNGRATAGSFQGLQSVMSISQDEYIGLVESMATEGAMRRKLMAANESDRLRIIQNTMARVEANAALGMSKEQAIEAAKAMDRLAGETPIERMKKAARLQATMGAMGIGGGDRAREIMMKGSRATAAEQQELQKSISSLQGTMVDAKMSGLGGEIVAATLTQKTGMEEYLGDNSILATRLASGLAVSDEMRDGQKFLRDQMPGWMETTWRTLDKIGGNMMHNPIVNSVVAMGQFLGGILMGPILTALAVNALSGAGGLKNILGKGKNALGNVAKSGAGIAARGAAMAGPAAGVLAAGAGGYYVGTKIHENMSPETSDAIGKGIAQTLAFFGNEEAQRSLDANERMEKMKTAPRISKHQDQLEQDKKKAAEKTASKTNESVRELQGLNSELASVNIHLQKQLEVQKRITEQNEHLIGLTESGNQTRKKSTKVSGTRSTGKKGN